MPSQHAVAILRRAGEVVRDRHHHHVVEHQAVRAPVERPLLGRVRHAVRAAPSGSARYLSAPATTDCSHPARSGQAVGHGGQVEPAERRRSTPSRSRAAPKMSPVWCGEASTSSVYACSPVVMIQLGRGPVELVGRRRCRCTRRRPSPSVGGGVQGRVGLRRRLRRLPAAARLARRTPRRTARTAGPPGPRSAARLRVAAVDGGCSSRGCGSRCGSSGRPVQFCVVDLVVGHAGAAARRPGTCMLQQELQLPAGLVEDVGHAVAALRAWPGAVASCRRAPAASWCARTRCISWCDRDAAVDDVLAVVAGVVPAAA